MIFKVMKIYDSKQIHMLDLIATSYNKFETSKWKEVKNFDHNNHRWWHRESARRWLGLQNKEQKGSVYSADGK